MANKKGTPVPDEASSDALDAPEAKPRDGEELSDPGEITRALDAQPAARETPTFDASQSCTTVGPSVVIRGKIRSDENLVVYGRIEAGVRSTKDVRVEATGIINSDIDVRSVWVAGIVVGDIKASQLVELSPEARVVGNIQSARLVVRDGARFRGRVEMDGLAALEAVKPAPPKKATATKPPPVAEVIWSDVEDLGPAPAQRPGTTPPARPAPPAAATGPAQVSVAPRPRPPTAQPAPPAASTTPPPKPAEKPAAPPAQPSADKGAPPGDDKGIGSWFRRQ